MSQNVSHIFKYMIITDIAVYKEYELPDFELYLLTFAVLQVSFP